MSGPSSEYNVPQRREEHYQGITPDELCDLRKLLVLLDGAAPGTLAMLVQGLEAIVESGNGEVMVAYKQGAPVFVKTSTSKSTQRRGR